MKKQTKEAEKYNLRKLPDRQCCDNCIMNCPVSVDTCKGKIEYRNMVCDAWKGSEK